MSLDSSHCFLPSAVDSAESSSFIINETGLLPSCSQMTQPSILHPFTAIINPLEIILSLGQEEIPWFPFPEIKPVRKHLASNQQHLSPSSDLFHSYITEVMSVIEKLKGQQLIVNPVSVSFHLPYHHPPGCIPSMVNHQQIHKMPFSKLPAVDSILRLLHSCVNCLLCSVFPIL